MSIVVGNENPSSVDWSRLPVSAVVALYISGLQKVVRQNMFAFFGVGTGAFVSNAIGLREVALILGSLLLIGLLVSVLYHRRFRFLLLDDAIRVRKGLFEQIELKVRFERVQNVAFSQPLYLKPLGLTRVTLETPGAAQTEVELPGIPTDDALALRERVSSSHRAGIEDRGVEADENATSVSTENGANAVFAPGFGDLFRYGMTSSQLWIILAVVGGPLADTIGNRVGDAVEWLEASGIVAVGELAAAPLLAVMAVLGLIALFIATGLMISGLIAVVRFHGFRLTGDAKRLSAEYGLLDKREKSLKRDKLHSLEIVQTAFGRALKRWHMVGHQAAPAAANPMNQDKRFLVPGVPNDRLADVASELANRPWSLPAFQGIDRRFRTRLWARIVVLPLCIGLALNLLLAADKLWMSLPLFGVAVLVATLIHFRWKRWGVHVGKHGLQIREGLVGTTILLFEDIRCQQVKVTRSPHQRRHGLATLVIGLPHGEKKMPYLSESLAAELANRLLYRVERSTEHAL